MLKEHNIYIPVPLKWNHLTAIMLILQYL